MAAKTYDRWPERERGTSKNLSISQSGFILIVVKTNKTELITTAKSWKHIVTGDKRGKTDLVLIMIRALRFFNNYSTQKTGKKLKKLFPNEVISTPLCILKKMLM